MNICIPLLLALCQINHAAAYAVADPENHPTLLKEIFPKAEGPAVVGRPINAEERQWMTREVADDFDVVGDPRFDPRIHSNSRIFGFKIRERNDNLVNAVETTGSVQDNSNDGTSTSDGVPPELDFSSGVSGSDNERKSEWYRQQAIDYQKHLDWLAVHDPAAFYKKRDTILASGDINSNIAKRAAPKFEEVSATDDSDRPIVLPDGKFMKPNGDTKYYEWSMTEDTDESEEEEMALAKHLRDYFRVMPPCGKNSPEDKLACRILQENPHPGTPVRPPGIPELPESLRGDPSQPTVQPGVQPGVPPPAAATPNIPAPGVPPHEKSPQLNDPWAPEETQTPAANTQPEVAEPSPKTASPPPEPVEMDARSVVDDSPSTDLSREDGRVPPARRSQKAYLPIPLSGSRGNDFQSRAAKQPPPVDDINLMDDRISCDRVVDPEACNKRAQDAMDANNDRNQHSPRAILPYLPIPGSENGDDDIGWQTDLFAVSASNSKPKSSPKPKPKSSPKPKPKPKPKPNRKPKHKHNPPTQPTLAASHKIGPVPRTTPAPHLRLPNQLQPRLADVFGKETAGLPEELPFRIHGKPARGGERWDHGVSTFVTRTRTAEGAQASR